MSITTGRSFNPDDDVRRLQIFLAEMRRQVSQAAYFQFGDLLWRMHYWRNNFDPNADLRIWEDGYGRIKGFVFYLAPDANPEFLMHPELYDAETADEMIAWAMVRSKMDGASTIETSCADHDVAKANFLKRAGFQLMEGDAMVFMARRLDDDDVPIYPLPDADYTIIPGIHFPEFPSVTGNLYTPAQYATVCNAPGYKPDLALRACYKNREIASGCICWYDDEDNCGEFEPVGTHEAHRGKGLASAVMTRTLENLKQYGADVAYVRTYKENLAAVRLYQKLGFAITHEDYGWKLSLS